MKGDIMAAAAAAADATVKRGVIHARSALKWDQSNFVQALRAQLSISRP